MVMNAPDRPKSPSVNLIITVLERRIRTGEYQNGQWLPTERALADEFGVSRATIRQVLNELERRNYVLRANGCRPRVLMPGAPESSPNLVRRSISVWITTNPGDMGAYSTLQGIQHSLKDDLFRLVMSSPSRHTLEAAIQSEAQFLDRVAAERDIVGVILWYLGGERNLPRLEALRAANIPMVFMDRQPPAGFAADYVGVDNVHAAREAVKHLLARGHRRIAHITNPELACTVLERRAGYQQALEEAGIPFRPELVLTGDFMEETEDAQDHVYAALAERLINLPDPPTAVFAVNDHSALALFSALQVRGIRVPEDIAVVGFDDLERWMPGKPFLTTVRQPFERMGAEAVKLLRHRIETGPTDAYRHLILDTSLVVRDSTRRYLSAK